MCILAPRRDSEGFHRLFQSLAAAISRVATPGTVAPPSPSPEHLAHTGVEGLLHLDPREWDAIESYRDEYTERRDQPDFEAARLIARIAELDDASLSLLRRYRREHRLAVEQIDTEGAAFFEQAIRTVVFPESVVFGATQAAPEAVEAESAEAPRSALRRAFLRAYFDLKARAGLTTIEAVAERSGLHANTVRKVERGEVLPVFETRRRLAEAFGVDVSLLMVLNTSDDAEPDRQAAMPGSVPRARAARRSRPRAA
jgi:DNA-binding XRE family transcriptional regulator